MESSEVRYTKEHEWIQTDGRRARVGITDYAQKQLGDVVYLELPSVGKTLKQGESFGTVESVKAVSDLYAPVSGTVVEVNTALAEHPEEINRDPRGSWMVALEIADPLELEQLLTATQYSALVR